MGKEFECTEVKTGLPAETALDVAAATLANLVPRLGGPVASLLSGISGSRKAQRILARAS